MTVGDQAQIDESKQEALKSRRSQLNELDPVREVAEDNESDDSQVELADAEVAVGEGEEEEEEAPGEDDQVETGEEDVGDLLDLPPARRRRAGASSAHADTLDPRSIKRVLSGRMLGGARLKMKSSRAASRVAPRASTGKASIDDPKCLVCLRSPPASRAVQAVSIEPSRKNNCPTQQVSNETQ